MQVNEIYPRVMYEVLGSLSREDESLDSGPIDPMNSMVSGLIVTRHRQLVDRVLADEKMGPYNITQILQTYLELGDLEKVLEILNKYPESNLNFEFSNFGTFIEKLIQGSYPHSLLLQFVEFIKTKHDHFSFLSVMWVLLRNLWKDKRFDIAGTLISTFLSGEDQQMYLLVHNLHQGKPPTSEEVAQAIEVFCNTPSDEAEEDWRHRQGVENSVHRLIQELDTNNAGIPILKTAIVTYKEIEKTGKVGQMYYLYDIEQKIRNYYYERNEFVEAEEFIDATGGRKYHLQELLYLKLDYAISSGNQGLHNETLQRLIALLDKKIEELSSTDTEERDAHHSLEWARRSDLCKAQANKYCELAIYELLYGEKEKAGEYIDLMVKHTESIVQDIPEGCSKRNRGHYKGRIKRRFKKELKERFLELGLFEYLPSDFGWNKPIKDPKQRKKEQEANKGKKEIIRQKAKETNEAEQQREEAEKNELLQMFLEENDVDGAINHVVKSAYYYIGAEDWERAMLILDHSPESFHELFCSMSRDCFDRDSYMGERADYEALAVFFAKGQELGVVQESDWETLIGRLSEGRFSRDSMRSVKHEAVVSLVKQLIAIGDIQHAWEFFEKVRNLDDRRNPPSIDHKTASVCLNYFIRATAKEYSRDGASLAFSDADLDSCEDIPALEEAKYWNTKADIACLSGNQEEYQASVSKLREVLESSSDPAATIRLWCTFVATNNLRNHHQLKNEMNTLLGSENGKIESVRRRIIYSLIELGVPGMEAAADVKRKDTPLRMQHFFLRKLVQKGYLSVETGIFLGDNWREHVPYLRRLLAQHQNEFNTVIETLHNGTPFHPSEWDNVFKVLNIVGVMTPGIWAQAKLVNFNEDALSQLSQKIRTAKKAMFRNQPFQDDLAPELQAELVYQAFRPANMSYHSVEQQLDRIHDCSHHLEKYTFPEDGYAVDISQRRDVAFRRGKVSNKALDNLQETIQKERGALGKDTVQALARGLLEAGRLKMDAFDGDGIENLLTLFLGDHYFKTFENLRLTSSNDRYRYLQGLKDFVDVYLGDNLEGRILSFFRDNPEFTSGMWRSFQEGLTNKRRKQNIGNQLKIDIPEEVNEELAARVITRAILQKSKALRGLRKAINQELKDYVNPDGSEIAASSVKLKAYVSKNKASFFAKASAGLCTSGNIEFFEREDHFHINIVDETKQQCVGNLMAYEVDRDGEKVLLLRGFNPNTSLLKEIDVPSYCDAMIDVATQFARDNNFDRVYITEDMANWHALSNRHEVKDYLIKKYGGIAEEFKFNIVGRAHINAIHPVVRIQKGNVVPINAKKLDDSPTPKRRKSRGHQPKSLSLS